VTTESVYRQGTVIAIQSSPDPQPLAEKETISALCWLVKVSLAVGPGHFPVENKYRCVCNYCENDRDRFQNESRSYSFNSLDTILYLRKDIGILGAF